MYIMFILFTFYLLVLSFNVLSVIFFFIMFFKKDLFYHLNEFQWRYKSYICNSKLKFCKEFTIYPYLIKLKIPCSHEPSLHQYLELLHNILWAIFLCFVTLNSVVVPALWRVHNVNRCSYYCQSFVWNYWFVWVNSEGRKEGEGCPFCLC